GEDRVLGMAVGTDEIVHVTVDDVESGVFFFSSRRRHTRCLSDWSSDVCSSDLFYLNSLRQTVGSIQVESFCHTLRASNVFSPSRSEERRVGKECRSRWSPEH